MNPRTAHVVYCAPEEMAVQQASADLARHYGLPTFGYGGCSDSLVLDEQWAFEAGMTLLTAAQAGVTLLHDIGYVASGTATSYESVVVMDELVGWVKAYLDGVTIDTEALAVDEIDAVGPGGSAPGAQVHAAARARLHHAEADLPGPVRRLGGAGGSTRCCERTAQKTQRAARERARLRTRGGCPAAAGRAGGEGAAGAREGLETT